MTCEPSMPACTLDGKGSLYKAIPAGIFYVDLTSNRRRKSVEKRKNRVYYFNGFYSALKRRWKSTSIQRRNFEPTGIDAVLLPDRI